MFAILLITASFYKDVLPILQDHCQQCHRPGQIAPMPLVTYAQARSKAKLIAEMVRSKRMPPWFADPKYGHFANNSALTDQQIATLTSWVENGTPAGDPRDAPPGKQWSEGWNIASPDRVIQMPKPVSIALCSRREEAPERSA